MVKNNVILRFFGPILLCLPGIYTMLCTDSLGAQDLYDFSHSKQFASYLMQSRQYEPAAREFERLIFMKPDNDTLKAGLMRAFRLGNQGPKGIARYEEWRLQTPELSPLLQMEYGKTMLSEGNYQPLFSFLTTDNQLDTFSNARLRLYAYTMEQSWPEAQTLLGNWPSGKKLPRRNEFESIIIKGSALHLKKPGLALTLSAVVPGLGKAYAGQWKDGLIGFIFVGLNTWQAYRRFDAEGLDTFWGWVHGGLALGFYTGNLYGSHKAARQYNARKRKHLFDETRRLVFSVLD